MAIKKSKWILKYPPKEVAKKERKRDQGNDILGIVETKRKDRKDGVEQLTSYMTATCCAWGVWTNGEEIEYLYKEPATGRVKRDTIYQIPRYGETVEDIGAFTKQGLKTASNLKTTKSSANLREHMNTSSAIKMTVPANSDVKVVNSFFGDWREIYYNGKTGYMHSSLLKRK